MLAVHHFSSWGVALLLLALACGLNLLFRWYWREAQQLRRRWRRARRIRAWRDRMTAMTDQPFHLQLLTKAERANLISHRGLTSEQWFRGAVAEAMVGQRKRLPTCGDYLDAFGKRPKVRPAEPRTPVRN